MIKKKVFILMTSMTMLLGLTACIENNATDERQDGLVATNGCVDIRDLPSAIVEEVVPLGDFKAQDFDENTITNDIFADYDLTMINLWTTSCGYCIEEMPVLNELREELQDEGKRFNVISICMDIGDTESIKATNLNKAKEIINKTGVNYPNLIPDSVLLEGRLKDIQAFPESFFVDKEGNVISQPYVGALSKNHWRVTIENEIDKFSKSTDKE